RRRRRSPLPRTGDLRHRRDPAHRRRPGRRPLTSERNPMSKPTIVLVHGAFGDASSWRGVFDLLNGSEYTLLAAALPLGGVASDAAYLEAVIGQLEGPVVLVGHSYAGCVTTVAGVSDKVAALVYVDAFMPDAGETITDLQTRFPSLVMGNF